MKTWFISIYLYLIHLNFKKCVLIDNYVKIDKILNYFLKIETIYIYI